MIDVVDEFLEDHLHHRMFEYCKSAKYRYGECDEYGLPPVGMVSDIVPDGNKSPFDLFEDRIGGEFYPKHQGCPYRMYINLFTPGEIPFWHKDGEQGTTFIYYPNMHWEPNMLGETQFLIDGEITGIIPKPNRLVGFDANISHRATSFRSEHRFSIAIKYYE